MLIRCMSANVGGEKSGNENLWRDLKVEISFKI